MHSFYSFLNLMVHLCIVTFKSPAAKIFGSAKSTGKNKCIKFTGLKFTQSLSVSPCNSCRFRENISRFTCRLPFNVIDHMVLFNIRSEALV